MASCGIIFSALNYFLDVCNERLWQILASAHHSTKTMAEADAPQETASRRHFSVTSGFARILSSLPKEGKKTVLHSPLQPLSLSISPSPSPRVYLG
jgi:hypothetical protein